MATVPSGLFKPDNVADVFHRYFVFLSVLTRKLHLSQIHAVTRIDSHRTQTQAQTHTQTWARTLTRTRRRRWTRTRTENGHGHGHGLGHGHSYRHRHIHASIHTYTSTLACTDTHAGMHVRNRTHEETL